MPSAKSGTAGTLVAPATPRSAVDADNAIPGEAEKNRQVSPPPAHMPDPKKKGWIEIIMVDEDNQPLSGVVYSITLPDGKVAGGTLGDTGVARVEGFDPGTCQVTFPDLDTEAWSNG